MVWASVRVLGAGRVEQRSNVCGRSASAEDRAATDKRQEFAKRQGNRGQGSNRETLESVKRQGNTDAPESLRVRFAGQQMFFFLFSRVRFLLRVSKFAFAVL